MKTRVLKYFLFITFTSLLTISGKAQNAKVIKSKSTSEKNKIFSKNELKDKIRGGWAGQSRRSAN